MFHACLPPALVSADPIERLTGNISVLDVRLNQVGSRGVIIGTVVDRLSPIVSKRALNRRQERVGRQAWREILADSLSSLILIGRDEEGPLGRWEGGGQGVLDGCAIDRWAEGFAVAD